MPLDTMQWFRTTAPNSSWTLDLRPPGQKHDHRIHRDRLPTGTAEGLRKAICAADVRSPTGGVDKVFFGQDRGWYIAPSATTDDDGKITCPKCGHRFEDTAAADAATAHLLAIGEIVSAVGDGSARTAWKFYKSGASLEEVRRQLAAEPKRESSWDAVTAKLNQEKGIVVVQ